MKKLKQQFMEDPQFAVTVIAVGSTLAAGVLLGSAKLLTASTYAYRASKMKK